MSSAKDYTKLSSQEKSNKKKLKIPPAYVTDQWVCNHKSANKKKYLDSLNLSEIKFQFNKTDKSMKNNLKPIKILNDKEAESIKRNNQLTTEPLSKIPEIKEKNVISKLISNNINKVSSDLKSKNKQKALFTKINKNDLKNYNKNLNEAKIYENGQSNYIKKIQDISINEFESNHNEDFKNDDNTKLNSNEKMSNYCSLDNSNHSIQIAESVCEKHFINEDDNKVKYKENDSNQYSKNNNLLSKSDSQTTTNTFNDELLNSRKKSQSVDYSNISMIRQIKDDIIVDLNYNIDRNSNENLQEKKEKIEITAHEYVESIIEKSLDNLDHNPSPKLNKGDSFHNIEDTQNNYKLNQAKLDENKSDKQFTESKNSSSPNSDINESKKNFEIHNVTRNYQQLIEFEDFNKDETYWVVSGKTKVGLQVERLYRKYKSLSKEKRYYLILIIMLLFILILLLIFLMYVIYQVPKSQMIYLSLLDNNKTFESTVNTSLNSTKQSTLIFSSTKLITTILSSTTISTTTVTTSKKIGLVGDSCIKVIGDCSKYMECKKHENMMSNISTCGCLDGYIANNSRYCNGLYNSYCETDSDCFTHLICDKNQKKCICKVGYYPKTDKTCFGMYNSSCNKDTDCLKNGECKFEEGKKICKCNSKERTVYKPESVDPYYQCRLLIGSRCQENNECIDFARCNKYCSCKEADLFFETENYTCVDACKNKHIQFGIKYPHPRRCGYYFTCLPRDLDVCPLNYSFDVNSQSCNSTILCR